MDSITVRGAQEFDLEHIIAIEAACFPPEEAASLHALTARFSTYGEHFLVADVDGKPIGFINGCATNSPVIYDDMFHDTSCHEPTGQNLTIFGLDVHPDYRRRGIAGMLLKHFIAEARKAGKRNVILTCKHGLVRYYETFGFRNDGKSLSSHGGAQWFDMTLPLVQ